MGSAVSSSVKELDQETLGERYARDKAAFERSRKAKPTSSLYRHYSKFMPYREWVDGGEYVCDCGNASACTCFPTKMRSELDVEAALVELYERVDILEKNAKYKYW